MNKLDIRRGMDCQILSSSPIHKGKMGKVVDVDQWNNTVRLAVPGHGDQNVVALSSIILWINERFEPVQGLDR